MSKENEDADYGI